MNGSSLLHDIGRDEEVAGMVKNNVDRSKLPVYWCDIRAGSLISEFSIAPES